MSAGGAGARGALAPPAPTGAGPIPFEREACGGKHLGTPLRDARPLHWMLMYPPYDNARSVEHTCDRCRPISYELLNLGGAFLIRRTQRKGGKAVVHETARVPQRKALEWWQSLRYGAAT